MESTGHGPQSAEMDGVLATHLRALGIQPGQCLLVHASLSSIGQVAGGASTVTAALRSALGSTGTLVVPTGTPDNSDTSRVYLARIAGMTPEQAAQFRSAMPPFDPATTPSTGAGRIAETVRMSPDAIRSAHPQTSFAAVGPAARLLMQNHELDCHLGEASPLGRLYQEDAWILMLGVGYEACTALHLAEYRYSPDPPRRIYRCVVAFGDQPRWCEFEDVILDDSDLLDIGLDFDRTGKVKRGRIGSADCRLMRMTDVVDFATQWLSQHRST